MSDEDDDDGLDAAPAATTTTATAGAVTPQMAAIAARFMQGQKEASARAAGVVSASVAGDDGDDDDEPEAPAPSAAKAAPAKPAAEAAAPEAAAPDEDEDEHLDRLAGGPEALAKPSRKDALRAELAARGVPDALAKALVSHGKTKDIEAWIRGGSALPSTPDVARQPSAPPVATPAPAPAVARQESSLRAALAGVEGTLKDSGLLEKREAESLVGVLSAIVDRQDRIEAATAESQHAAGRERFRAELRSAREGLAERFPQVLDNTVYRDRIAPVLEALVTSPTTGGRPLAANLAAACRAALAETTDADSVSRELDRSEGSRRQLAAPRTRSRAAETISPNALAADLLRMRMSGGGTREDMIEHAKRFEGRVR